MRTFDFEQDAVGQPPKGFVFGHTAKTGAPGRWVVQQDGGGKCLAQTRCRSHAHRVSRRGAVGRDRRGCRSVRALQADLRTRRSGRRSRVALSERGQLLHRPRQCARRQRRALQGAERAAHGPAGQRRRPHLRQEGQTCPRGHGARCASWRTGLAFEVYFNGTKLYEVEDTTFTAGREESASGPKPTRSPISTT